MKWRAAKMGQATPDHPFSRLRGLFFGGCFLILLAPAGVFQNNDVCCDFSSSAKPIWKVVLAPPVRPEDRCEWYNPDAYGTIAYTDSETIVAGFHFRSCPQTTKGSLGLRHVVDKILKIDSQTGNVLERREWQDLSTEEQNWLGEIEIIPTRDGRFLVKVGRFLKLFSSDFKELKSRELLENAHGMVRENWTVQVSTDGKTGLFKRWNHDGPATDHWFSTDTLDDEAVETILLEGRKSVNSASAVYFTPPRGGGPGNSLAHVRLRGQQESHPLCPGCGGVPEGLLSDGTIFLATGPKASFLLVSQQGEIIQRASLGDPMDDAQRVVSASGAPRFAFTFGHVQKRFISWSAPTSVVVFDYRHMKKVLQIKFNQQFHNISAPLGSWPMPALSPDGTRVALLTGKVLKLFRVPD